MLGDRERFLDLRFRPSSSSLSVNPHILFEICDKNFERKFRKWFLDSSDFFGDDSDSVDEPERVRILGTKLQLNLSSGFSSKNLMDPSTERGSNGEDPQQIVDEELISILLRTWSNFQMVMTILVESSKYIFDDNLCANEL